MGAASTSAEIAAGLAVKDKTGAAIGEVTEVKTDASGAKLATIKMGDKTFSVATTSLGVSGGAATINATQAEVQAMIAKTGS